MPRAKHARLIPPDIISPDKHIRRDIYNVPAMFFIVAQIAQIPQILIRKRIGLAPQSTTRATLPAWLFVRKEDLWNLWNLCEY